MAIDLQTVYMIMADEMSNDFYKHPPSTFSIISILETMMISDPQSEFAIEKNKLVQDLINLNQQKEIVGKILWSRACEIILENTLDNLNEVQLSTTQWSNDTRELYMLLTRSTAYLRDMEMFFNVKPINRLQATIGACLMVEVYKEVTKSIADKVQTATISEPPTFDVKGMPAEGLAKIRHIGAWAIRKVVTNQQRYIRANMMTSNESTHCSVNRRHEIASLLEEHLIANFETLSATTKYHPTLSVTEDR